MKPRGFIWLGLAILAGFALTLLGARYLAPAESYRGSLIEPPLPAADFVLTDQHGRPFRLADHRGQVMLIFFGYTSCPDVCPTTLADFRRIRERLGERAGESLFLFITVDPARDTPERIRDYLIRFDPKIIGLTGELADLEGVWSDYFVYREASDGRPGGHYLVDHPARVYAVDRAGNLFLTYPFGMPAEAILQDVLQLIDTR